MVDKIYFRLPDYSPEKSLGYGLHSIKRYVNKDTGEITDKPLYKIDGFDLIYSELTQSTAVNGSIRKLYFGADSVKDFSCNVEIKEALYQLSELLKVPYKCMLKGSPSSIEIGKNFLVDMDCNAIIDAVERYSTFRPEPRENYKKFVGSIHDLTLYNKLEEIIAKSNSERKEVIREKHTGEIYLRIELKLKKKAAVNQKLWGYVNTLKDLLAFYDFLPYVLYKEIKRLEFYDEKLNVVKSFNGSSLKELNYYLLGIGIESYGLDNADKTAIYLAGVDDSYYFRTILKKRASLVKLHSSSIHAELLDSFRKQLNVSDECLQTLDIATDDFCFDVSSYEK